MALSFPYALDFLSKCLVAERIPLRLQRFDEISGSGDGRFWGRQLATPLWGATYALLSAGDQAVAREINAKIYALDGVSKSFLWADHYYPGPASGVTSGLGAVSVSSIRADRGAIALSGLPAGFRLTAGDYFSITYGNGRVYFGTFSEGGTAASGVISQKEMRPYLPLGVGIGATVQLVRPYFKAVVTEYIPFESYRGQYGDAAQITIQQKI